MPPTQSSTVPRSFQEPAGPQRVRGSVLLQVGLLRRVPGGAGRVPQPAPQLYRRHQLESLQHFQVNYQADYFNSLTSIESYFDCSLYALQTV